MAAEIYDFEAALDKKNAALDEVTDISLEDGIWIARYKDQVYRGTDYDDLMMQLGWFDNIDIVDSPEVIEVIEVLATSV